MHCVLQGVIVRAEISVRKRTKTAVDCSTLTGVMSFRRLSVRVLTIRIYGIECRRGAHYVWSVENAGVDLSRSFCQIRYGFLGQKNGPKPVKFLRSSRIFEIRPRSKMAAPHVRWKVRGSEATMDTEKHGICVYISKISISQYGSTHF